MHADVNANLVDQAPWWLHFNPIICDVECEALFVEQKDRLEACLHLHDQFIMLCVVFTNADFYCRCYKIMIPKNSTELLVGFFGI